MSRKCTFNEYLRYLVAFEIFRMYVHFPGEVFPGAGATPSTIYPPVRLAPALQGPQLRRKRCNLKFDPLLPKHITYKLCLLAWGEGG